MAFIPRSIHLPGSVSGFFRKVAKPQAKEKAEGSTGEKAKGSSAKQGEGTPKPPIVSGIKPKEKQLAGYLMARAAMHQKVEGPVLKNLRDGHETVQEVNDLLPLGRANVREDIQKGGVLRPDLRMDASLKVQEALSNMHWNTHGSYMTYEDAYRMYAATSLYAKTGVCDNITGNITTLHAAKLADKKEEGAIVAQANNQEVAHIWSEMLPKGKGADGKPILHGEDVIMDGWGKERLATLREDSNFARLDKNGKGDHLEHNHLLDHQSGPAALDQVKKYKAQIEGSPVLQSIYHNEFHRLVAGVSRPVGRQLWDDQSVFHADFRQQAGSALHKDARHPAPHKEVPTQGADPASIRAKQASLAEIQAVGVGRSLGSNIRGAVAEAPGIIASAKNMFPTQGSKGGAAGKSKSKGKLSRSKGEEIPSQPSRNPSRRSGIASRLSAFFRANFRRS